MNFQTTVVGYPRVGVGRPYKQALERFWSGKLDETGFRAAINELRQDRLATQAQRLELVSVGDFSLYDHVLDTALMLGAVPARFGKIDACTGLFCHGARPRWRASFGNDQMV